MTEEVLKKYFDGVISIEALSADLKDSIVKTGYDTSRIHITPFEGEGEYFISRHHLLKLCNDTIDGHLTPIDLNTAACGLMASDYFYWDNTTKEGKIVADTLFDWDNPDIGFPITKDNLSLWRVYLETGEYVLKYGKHNVSK